MIQNKVVNLKKRYALVLPIFLVLIFALFYSTNKTESVTEPISETEVPENENPEGFFQVPEFPLGSILALITFLLAFTAYSASRHIWKSQNLKPND